jgi:hypothetical protein
VSRVSQLPLQVDADCVAGNPLTLTLATDAAYSSPARSVFGEDGEPVPSGQLPTISATGGTLTLSWTAEQTAAMCTVQHRPITYRWSARAQVLAGGPFEQFAGELVVHPVGTAGIPSSTVVTARVVGSLVMPALAVPLHAGAPLPVATIPGSATFLSAAAGIGAPVDLTGYRQARLTTRVVTRSITSGSPRARLVFRSAWSDDPTAWTQAANSGEIAASLSTVGVADSGWVDIAIAARGPVLVAADVLGGTVSANAQIGTTVAQFR